MEVIYGTVWYINRIPSYIKKKYRIYDYSSLKTRVSLDYASDNKNLQLYKRKALFININLYISVFINIPFK